MVTKIISVLSAKHLAIYFSCALMFSHFIVSFKVFEICAADAFFFHTSVLTASPDFYFVHPVCFHGVLATGNLTSG